METTPSPLRSKVLKKPPVTSLASAFAASIAVFFATCPASLAFDLEQWETLSRAGQKAYEVQNWGGAEKNFLAALDQLRGATDEEKGAHLADSLSNLGMLYSTRGQFAKAESFYEKSLKVKEYVLGSLDKGVLASQAKLCQLYLSQGKKDKALVLSEKLAVYGEAQSRELSEVANSFDHLQKFYDSHKKLLKVAQSVKDAEQSTLNEMKDQCQEVAILLDGVGMSIKDVGGESGKRQAERLFKSALALRQRSLAPEHAALASSLENLGRLYLSEGKPERAEPLMRSSYDISVKTLGAGRQETILRLDGLAQVLTNEGKLSEAENLYRHVLGEDQGKAAKGSRSQADMAANMAALLVKQGRYSEAVPYYSRALKIQESINGPQSASLSNLLDSYAYALSKSNRGGEAKKLSARAKSIRG
jgi:tetratricopeptide (TPR) repeat protein